MHCKAVGICNLGGQGVPPAEDFKKEDQDVKYKESLRKLQGGPCFGGQANQGMRRASCGEESTSSLHPKLWIS